MGEHGVEQPLDLVRVPAPAPMSASALSRFGAKDGLLCPDNRSPEVRLSQMQRMMR
jgi:hypothetical protein